MVELIKLDDIDIVGLSLNKWRKTDCFIALGFLFVNKKLFHYYSSLPCRHIVKPSFTCCVFWKIWFYLHVCLCANMCMQTPWRPERTLCALEPAMGVYELSDTGFGNQTVALCERNKCTDLRVLHRPLPRPSHLASELPSAALADKTRFLMSSNLRDGKRALGGSHCPCHFWLLLPLPSCYQPFLLLSPSLREPDTHHTSTLQFSGPPGLSL